MNLTKMDVFKNILNSKKYSIKNNSEICFAPINIALIKYWGKSNEELNLAITPSLSISSSILGTKTQIFISNKDEIIINNMNIDGETFERIFGFVNLWRKAINLNRYLKIVSQNNVPTASGLASSASGFSALTLALNDLLSLNLSQNELSILARIGSGSACRSVFKDSRFAIWNGDFAEPFSFSSKAKTITNEIELLIFILDKNSKKISSREAMRITKQTWQDGKNYDYELWLKQTKHDFYAIQTVNNWQEFGKIVEQNSLLMHKAITTAGIDYFNEKTKIMLKFVKNCRADNLFVYLTIDAGANVVLIYQKKDETKLLQAISDLENNLKIELKKIKF